MTGLYLKVFGQNILIAKLVPLTIGLCDFYLLYKISKHVLKNKYVQAFVLFIYTISSLIIFNHFYIRVYVFYEFFALGVLWTFIGLNESLKQKSKSKVISYSAILLTLNAICGFASFDLGSNYILLISGILLISIYFSSRFDQLISLLFSGANSLNGLLKPIQNRIIIFLGIGITAFWLLDIPAKVNRLAFGDLAYGSGYGYYNLFFVKNGIWTVFLLISLLMISRIKNYYQKIFIFISLLIFYIGFNMNPQAQISRGFLFFIPIYYLVVCTIVENTNFLSINKKTIIVILLTINTIICYPVDFFRIPRLAGEVNYIDYKKANLFIKNNCSDKNNFALIHAPYLSQFYNSRIDYTTYILSNTFGSSSVYGFDENRNLITLYGNIKVITDNKFASERIDGNSCLVISTNDNDNSRYLTKKDQDYLINYFNKKEVFERIQVLHN
jgi:hypothetical protein